MYNKSERVSKEARGMLAKAPTQRLEKKIQNRPTHLQTLARAGIQSEPTPCDAYRDHHSEKECYKKTIVERWGASPLEETKA